MIVVKPAEMALLETKAYQDGASEYDFMEEAGSGIALVVQEYMERNGLGKQATLLCGKGNNGGDAFVAGIHLLHLDFDVIGYLAAPPEKCSPLCQESYYRFTAEGGKVIPYEPGVEMAFSPYGVIIDGLFGTGFKGEIKEPYHSMIKAALDANIPIISVDIPSGLNGESGKEMGICIKAEETAFLGLPKTGFFLNDGWNAVGRLRYVDFGLPKGYLSLAQSDFRMLTPQDIKPHLPHLVRNRHKYAAGHVVGWAGSSQFPGAGILSSYAALKGGAGIVRLLYEGEKQHAFLQSAPFELIQVPISSEKEIIQHLNEATASFIGPGLGQASFEMIRNVLPEINVPLVLDADALNALAEAKMSPPKNAVLTPHLGELKRLFNLSETPKIDEKFLEKARAYVEEKSVTLVIKGGPTFIVHPGQPIYVNPTGNPGMATAGSGDILTGLIAALLAQKLTPLMASCLGAFIHGTAGDFAALEYTFYCMTATEILSYFPEGFRLLEV